MAECGATILPATLIGSLVHLGPDGACAGLKASLIGVGSSRECGQTFGLTDLAMLIGPDGLIVEAASLGDITQPLPCDETATLCDLLAQVIAVDANGEGALLSWDDGEIPDCEQAQDCLDVPLETMLRGCFLRLESNGTLRFRVAILSLGDAVECGEAMPLETALKRCLRSYGDGRYALNIMVA